MTKPIIARQLNLIPDEPIEFLTKEGIRAVILDGEKYVSILDTYKVYGNSSNPNRDWKRDTKALTDQGWQGLPKLVAHVFAAGNRNRQSTPVANLNDLYRIAQVAKFKNWEPLRQEMADNLADNHKGKAPKAKPPIRQSKEFRAYLEAGYTPQAAERAVAIRESQKSRHHLITETWKHRGANSPLDFAALTNAVTYAATGKTATQWKEDLGAKGTPRDRMSAFKNAMIESTEMYAGFIHEDRNSQGIDALESDIYDAGSIIDHEKLRRLLSDRDLPKQLPAPKQLRLAGGSK